MYIVPDFQSWSQVSNLHLVAVHSQHEVQRDVDADVEVKDQNRETTTTWQSSKEEKLTSSASVKDHKKQLVDKQSSFFGL